MLKKIYQELVAIRKELQAIRSSKELSTEIKIDGKEVSRSAQRDIRDSIQGVSKRKQCRKEVV